MSYELPITGSPLRELFTLDHLAEVVRPENIGKIPSMRDLKARYNKGLSKGTNKVVCFCITASGKFTLVSVGKRGAIKVLWTFCQF
jgi:hypothetical protein